MSARVAHARFSFARVAAVFRKELVQMRRDRITFAMMLGLPIVQLLLFGYAINTDPRHMPTAVEAREDGPLTRAFLAAMKQSTFFDLVAVLHREGEGDRDEAEHCRENPRGGVAPRRRPQPPRH